MMATELLPVTLAPSATAEPAAVFAVNVISLPVINPAVERFAAFALTVKAEPAPELLAFKVTVLAAVSSRLTVPVDLAVTLVALMLLAPVKLRPPVPELKLTVAAFKAPVPLMPPAASDAFMVNDVAVLAPSDTTPANVSLTLTTPVPSVMVKVPALSVPAVLKSTPPVPAFKLVVAEARLPVALIPPAASLALRTNDVPELLASCTTPAKVSLTVTAPFASETVKLVAFTDPALVKSTPPVPAVRLVVVEASAPVPLIPPAALEAFSTNVEPELAAS